MGSLGPACQRQTELGHCQVFVCQFVEIEILKYCELGVHLAASLPEYCELEKEIIFGEYLSVKVFRNALNRLFRPS